MEKTIYINILLALSVLSVNAQNVRMYAFGHSLIHHAAEFGGTPETNIMHWMNDISQEAGNTFATGGQYGFLTTHDDLPPVSSWGYNGITSVWDDSVEPFSDADINTILITAANFIQHALPTDPHPLDNTSTVIQSTETIFDWVDNQEPNVRFYIYGNWPEMNLVSDFPPTPPLQSEIDDFHNTTIGSFADWWTDYHDEMLSSRPLLNSRLIPVGVIISKILRDLIPNQIPFDSLYFDAAPHGRESIYFLAGMISYMAVYEQNIPAAYVPNTTVHSVIRNNLDAIRDFAWSELNNFNLPGGDSRVFYTNILSVENTGIEQKSPVLYPNPASDHFEIIDFEGASCNISIYDHLGKSIQTIDHVKGKIHLDNVENGVYFIHIENIKNKKILIKKLIINN